MINAVTQLTNLTTELLGLSGFSRESDLSVSSSAVQTGVLNEGAYDVWCNTDCFIKVGTTANDVTLSSGYLLRASNTITIGVGQGERIGAISVSSGLLSIHRVK